MLSISKRGNGAEAKNYLLDTATDYYISGSESRQIFNHGSGYEKLNISDSFDELQFEKMLSGKFNDQIVGRSAGNGEFEHAAGWDLTFSAPKSVSILAIEGGDQGLLDAHTKAVKAALDYAEKNKIFYRVSDENGTKLVKSDNAFFTTFLHTTSRELDPQLHTHSFLQNATVDKDGKVRSIESNAIFDAKMLLGKIYRAELAYHAQQLGHELNFTDPEKLFFEVASVPQHVIDAKSKRRQQIEEAIDKFGIKSQAQTEVAAIMTRQRKRNVSAKELHEMWEEENKALGFSPKEILDKTKEAFERSQTETPNIGLGSPDFIGKLVESKAIDDARLAYRAIAVNDAAFKHEKLLEKTLSLGRGRFGQEEATAAIKTLIGTGEILYQSSGDITTSEAVKVETQIVRIVAERMGDYIPISDQETIEKTIADHNKASEHPLSVGQEESFKSIFLSNSAVSGVDGWAGTGKTTLNKLVKSTAEAHSMVVKGIAPTGSATETLFNETGIESKTLASFLYEKSNKSQSALNEIWLLDESSLGNADELLKLVEASNKLGSRLVLLGDKKQHHSVEWGRVFQQLQDAGMPTAQMRDIFRQKYEAYRDAVIDAAQGNIKETFERIKEKITTNDLSDHIKTMSLNDLNETMFVIPANSDRVVISKEIRNRLMELGELKDTRELDEDKKMKALILTSAQMNRVTQTDARFYQESGAGFIQFQSDNLGFKKDSLWKITSVNASTNTLMLQNVKDEQLVAPLNLDKFKGDNDSRYEFSAYRGEQREITVGDKMIWRKSNKDLKLTNGDNGVIKSIDQNNGTYVVAFSKNDGSSIEHTFKAKDLNHIEWNYASTSFLAQGKQKPKVIGLLESHRRFLVNQQSFYVTLSRGEVDVQLFTDNVSKLIKQIEENTGENSAAIIDQKILKSIIADVQSEKAMRSDPASLQKAVEQVLHSVDVLTDKKGIFSQDDIVNHTIRYGFGDFSAKDITQAIKILQTTKHLSLVRKDDNRQTYFTSGEQLSREGSLSKLVREGIGKRTHYASQGYVDAFIESSNKRVIEQGEGIFIDQPKSNALKSILSGKDEITILDGNEHRIREIVSGTLQHIAGTRDVSIRSLSMNKATMDLHKSLGFKKTSNLWGFANQVTDMIAEGKKVSFRKEIWFIDYAGMASMENLEALTKLARATGAKIVLSNNHLENPFQGGRAIDLLKSQGVKSFDIDKTYEGNSLFQSSHALLEESKLSQALDVLDSHFVEVPGEDKEAKEKRVSVLASAYISSNERERLSTTVVIQDTRSRDLFNLMVRKSLSEQGVIDNGGVSLSSERSVFMTPQEKSDARYYTPGHSVIFKSEKTNNEGGMLPANEALTILNVNLESNTIELKDKDGTIHTWNPKDSTFSRVNSHDVVKAVRQTFSKGDIVKLGSHHFDENKKVIARNGDMARVELAENGSVSLKLENGKTLVMKDDKMHKLEYAYSSSHFGLKGNKSERVLALLDSTKPFNVTKENLANILSNAKTELSIVVDSKNKILETIKKQPEPPKSALAARQIVAATEKKGFVNSYGLAMSSTDKAFDRLTQITQRAAERVQQIQQRAAVERQRDNQQQLSR
ncbi:MobF family relaxase [Vibrio cholerae]